MKIVEFNELLRMETIELMLDCHHALYDKEFDFEPLSNRYKKILDDLSKLNSHKILLVQDQNKLLGYALFAINYDFAYSQYYMNIVNIWFPKQNQKAGYGSMLLNECIKRAKDLNCSKITLETNVSNNIARSFYKKFSFEEQNGQMIHLNLNLRT